MASFAEKTSAAVSMRFRPHDLQVIDRGAALAGMSRTEFMTRAAVHDAQMAILDARLIELSPDAWAAFEQAVDAPPGPTPPKLRERLSRKAPWLGA